MSKRWIYFWQWKCSIVARVFQRMDQWSKTTSHQKRDSDNLWHGELRSNRGSWLDKFFFMDTHEMGESFFFIFFILTFFTKTVGDLSVREREDAPKSDISPVPVSELVDDRSGKPVWRSWERFRKLQEFRENLVDHEIPLQGGSHASSSNEASLELTTKWREDLALHNLYTQTKIARSVYGPRLQGPHAEDGRDRLGQSWFGQSWFGQSVVLAIVPILAKANFGQSQFWPIQFWPIQFWPKPILVIQFWPIQFWPIQFGPIHFFGQYFWCHGGGPEGWGPRRVGSSKCGAPKLWGPEVVGPRSCEGPKLWGPEGWGPERWEPKISRFFFFPLPPQFFVLFCLSGCLLVEFWWCLKRRCAQMCTFGVLRLSCASPGGKLRAPNPSGPPFFLVPTLLVPTLRGPTLRGPTFSRFGPPHPSGLHPRGSTLLGGAQKGGAPMGKTPKH